MKANAKVRNPDAVEVTLEITMSLGAWKRLRDDLSVSYPAGKLSEHIGALVRRVSERLDSDDS